eukprot:gene6987-7201_t
MFPQASAPTCCDWMMQQDPVVLIRLLSHASCKVQMRAARLAHLLAKSRQWCEAFTRAGGAQLGMQLVCASNNSSATVQLHVFGMLQRLAGNSSIAMAAMVHSRQLIDALMGQLTDAGGVAASALAAAGELLKITAPAERLLWQRSTCLLAAK